MTEIELQAELNDLRMSKEAQPLFDAVKQHIAENVDPITEEFFRLGENRVDRWSLVPGQLELLEGAKNKAKAAASTFRWRALAPGARRRIPAPVRGRDRGRRFRRRPHR